MGGHGEIRKSHAGFDSVVDAPVAFRERYLHRLVPVLAHIDTQGSELTTSERLRAVRFAADMSLALTAAGAVNWSYALARNLNRQLSSSVEDDRVFRDNEHTSTVEYPTRATWCRSQETRLIDGIEMETSARPRQSVPKQPQQQQAAACADLNTSRRLRRRRRRRSSYKRCHVLSFGKVASWKRAYIKALRLRTARRRAKPTIVKEPTDQMSELAPLQKIIPGGRQLMDPVTLLQEAADYILSLQVQVEALNTLAEAAVH